MVGGKTVGFNRYIVECKYDCYKRQQRRQKDLIDT